MFQKITISATVNQNIEKSWAAWTLPEHIVNWNFASEDWQCPSASNDLRIGGSFNWRMEAKDGSFGFDFEGEYTNIVNHQIIEYKLGDERQVKITFEQVEGGTLVTEAFDAETENPIEMQQMGWQMILNNYKKHAESL
jgi:uncharacterized protein YndB with AHSA1/START domain